MKLNSPKNVAILIGMSSSLISGLVYLSLGLFYGQFSGLILVLILVLSGLVSFGVAFYALEYFINRKIRLIYRTIKNYKLGSKAESKLAMSDDVLSNVNKEVIDWANSSKAEIEKLTELENFRREFIGNLSHELKTPVFSIQGYILTLLEGGLEDSSINRVFLERASKGVDRMTHIIDDLETITRLEGRRLNLTLSSNDIVDLAKEVMDSFEMKATKRNIKITFDKRYDREIFVSMNRAAIGQVFTNLINNAINYSVENGVVEVRFHDMEDRILVEVSDDGIGISEDHLTRLFERFYRVDKSRNRNEGGTGLGLAIVKHIVESHGQQINVRSTLKVGSTFSFTLKKG